MRTSVTIGAVALGLSLVLTSCSSNSATSDESLADSPSLDTSAETASPSSSAAVVDAVADGVAVAAERVAGYLQAPTSVLVTDPITGEIPTGKNVAFMACGVPTCTTFGEIAQQAAELLGWNLTIVPAGNTPEEVNAAWKRMARTNPDAVIGIGYPRAVYEDTMKVLQERGTPVVAQGITDPVGDGLLYVTGTPDELEGVGAAMADWIIADTEGKANVLFVDNKDYQIVGAIKNSYEEEMSALCSACTTETFESTTADIGTKLPAQIVAKLRANPDLNYVALGIDAMSIGLPAALEAAGLDDRVKFIGQTGDPLNKQQIADGTQAASVPFASYEAMYRLIDVLARYFAGESEGMESSGLPVMIYDESNVGDPATYEPLVPDYADQYKALWNVQ